ncbi:MAG: type II secretion system secretin GspD [Pseudomonadota bacterium]
MPGLTLARSCGRNSAIAVVLLGLFVGACQTTPRGGPSEEPAQASQSQIDVETSQSADVETATAAPTPVVEGQDTGRSGLAGPEVYLGSGAIVSAGRGGEPTLEGGQVTLNFAGADIREVIDVILGDTLNVNYVVDPVVQGTVTVRTSDPIPRSAVIPALEDILALNGATLTLSEGLYKVVPLDQAATGLTGARVNGDVGASSGGFGVNIIPLSFASAEALREVLEPFVGPGRTLRVDPARNILIFSGNSAEARDLAEMVKIFDVDWMAGMSFGLFPLEVAEPTALIAELEQVFAQGGAAGLAGSIRFVPVERLGAILVIAPQSGYLQQAQNWIERLDRGNEGAGRRIFVYYVQNGRAADLAQILTQIFDGGSSESVSAVQQASLAPGFASADITDPDLTEDELEENIEVSRAVSGDSDGEGVSLVSSGGDIRVIADETKNALVILATAGEYRMIEATLERLDIQPLQVLIEATIAEVTLNDQLNFGLQWFFSAGNNSFTFSSLDTGDIASSFPGFSYAFGGADARVTLNALSQITDVNVISSPQLMVLDNETAKLQVGDEVPIATQSAVSVTDADSPVVNEIEFRDTGVILDVTPRVNSGGLVVLDIIQEVSDAISTDTSSIDSPTIQQRRIESTVAVHSGESVALGGLIRDQQTDGVTGVPLLSDVPVFGNLFKTTSTTTVRTELLILITPRVVGSRTESRDVTEELRGRLDAIEPLEHKIQ